MVGPPLITSPARVFARLTFTGEDKSLDPICCDLSRAATMAPANSLPNNVARKRKMSDSYSSKFIDNPSAKSINSETLPPSSSTTEAEESNRPAKMRKTTNEAKKIRAHNRKCASALLAENELLRKQNEILKKRVQAFQSYFQNDQNSQNERPNLHPSVAVNVASQ